MTPEYAGKGSVLRCLAGSPEAAGVAEAVAVAADATETGEVSVVGEEGPEAEAVVAAVTADQGAGGHPPTGPCRNQGHGRLAQPRRKEGDEGDRGPVRGRIESHLCQSAIEIDSVLLIWKSFKC